MLTVSRVNITSVDVYTLPIRRQSVDFMSTIHTHIRFIMLLQVPNVQSSMVKNLQVDARNHQAIVEYNNGSKYLYNNVAFADLYDLIYNQTDSIGQWVIKSCKTDNVQCVKL